MQQIFRNWLQVGILLELLVFGYILFFGRQGVIALEREHRYNQSIIARLEQVQQENGELTLTLQSWEKSNFMLEKQAREKLHLARPDEIIYYIR